MVFLLSIPSGKLLEPSYWDLALDKGSRLRRSSWVWTDCLMRMTIGAMM